MLLLMELLQCKNKFFRNNDNALSHLINAAAHSFLLVCYCFRYGFVEGLLHFGAEGVVVALGFESLG